MMVHTHSAPQRLGSANSGHQRVHVDGLGRVQMQMLIVIHPNLCVTNC